MSEKNFLMLIGFLSFWFGFFMTHSIRMVLTGGR